MLYLSEIMLKHHEVNSFSELPELVKEAAKNERFFQMDVKPSYPDTPENWEDILESAFSGLLS